MPSTFRSVTRRLAAVATAAALLAVAAASPAAAQEPDHVTSPNVELLKRIPTAGDGVGARVVGNYLYVTSTKDLEIFDITNPEDPQLVGNAVVNIEFENEEVPTNGKVLGISGQTPTVNTGGLCPSMYPLTDGGCLAIYDVRDKENPELVANVLEAGDHTSTCVLDCTYFYGSSGSVTDARGVLADPVVTPTKIGNWQDSATIPDYNGDDSGKFVDSCHHVQEIRAGILLGACQPMVLMSVNPEDGGSILAPKVLATGSNADGRFIHSAHWPRAGTDKFALFGGETNFQQQCHEDVGAFQTMDASNANVDGTFDGPLDEYRPVNGSYLDSNPPANILGCSVHWFEEHPTFHDGGLVAIANYENGTRFLQITPEGEIKEQGFFIPLGGSTSAPHWAPGGSDVVYAVDYTRGLDVLKYKGDHYVPGNTPEPGRVPGTSDPGGGSPPPAAAGGSGAPVCKASSGFRRTVVNTTRGARDGGPGPGLGFAVSRRSKRPFEVAVVQQARGNRLTRNRVIKRFTRRTRSFEWNGAGAPDGWYTVRFRMPLAGGGSDVRRHALRRQRGRFANRPASHLKDSCGALNSFKLQRPVFGGARNRPLKISYRLPRGVDSVSIVARSRGRVLRRFNRASTDPGRFHSLQLPSNAVRRGTDVRVRITVRRAGSQQVSTLVSRRI